MHPIAQLAAVLAALVHAWFLVLETVRFMEPSVHRRFGLTNGQASIVRFLGVTGG